MKLTLLEDGVLDYKGSGQTLAVPNPIPSGALNLRRNPPKSKQNNRLKNHINNCPVCSSGELCDFAERLIASI